MTVDPTIESDRKLIRDSRMRLRQLRRIMRTQEQLDRLTILNQRRGRAPNDERYHQQGRTLFFYMHKHLDVALPKRPETIVNVNHTKPPRQFINHARYKAVERVGTRNVRIGCHMFSYDENGKICHDWDEVKEFEVTFEMSFKGCFFWCRVRCDPDGENYRFDICMLGTTPDKMPIFEKLCRRYDGLMVMQKMINAQADYEGVA